MTIAILLTIDAGFVHFTILLTILHIISQHKMTLSLDAINLTNLQCPVFETILKIIQGSFLYIWFPLKELLFWDMIDEYFMG